MRARANYTVGALSSPSRGFEFLEVSSIRARADSNRVLEKSAKLKPGGLPNPGRPNP